MTKLINGKEISVSIKDEIANEVRKLQDAGERPPHLAAVLVGEDPASKTYIASKERACKEVGFTSSVYRYPANISEKELLEVVEFLNNDPEVDGFIVQLPLPKHIDSNKVIDAINYKKDVDGFHPQNVGRMTLGLPTYIPATPMGIMTLIEHCGIETAGKDCVVVGRSAIVGTPMSNLLSRNNKTGNATVTLCHSRTKNLAEVVKKADIIVVAIGQPDFITGDMVKQGATVIDVGINRVDDASLEKGYKIVGDVNFDEVAPKCEYITPVPGGVGPMTIIALLLNTFKAYKKEIYG